MEQDSIRKLFTPRPNKLFVRSDYSQLEVFINAHYSQDPLLIAALLSGEDVHSCVAKEIFNLECAVSEVKTKYKSKRAAAKAIVFGLAYGITAVGLARRLKISQEEAQSYIDAFFAKYTGLQASMNICQEIAITHKFIPTVMGRKRRFKFVTSRSFRQAMNFPIQATAAEVTKAAMVDVFGKIKGRKDIVMLMQIHDEILLEADLPAVSEAEHILKDSMEKGLSKFGIQLVVPVKTEPTLDYAWGFSLKDAKKEELDLLLSLRSSFDSMNVDAANKACKDYYVTYFRELKKNYDSNYTTLPGNDVVVTECPEPNTVQFRPSELGYVTSLFEQDSKYTNFRAKYW